MIKTRVSSLLGVDYPIIMGGLYWLGRGKLTAAVSEAGGFGLITASSFNNKQELLDEIEVVRGLTGKPFGLNISLGYRNMEEYFDAAVEANVSAVFTSGRNPVKYIALIKEAGIAWIHVAPTIRYAFKAAELGADAIVLTGIEAGGHPGPDDVTLMALIPKAVSLLSIPVIAAGAITNGATFLAALALGAEGVQIGSRFIATKECGAHPVVKELIINSDETDTIINNLKTGGRSRALKTEAVHRFLALNKKIDITANYQSSDASNSYLKVFKDGEIDKGSITIGQGLGTINEILTAEEVIKKIVSEAIQANKKLNISLG